MPACDVERAAAQVACAVGDVEEQAAVGRVVAHQHAALVGHDLHQFARDAAQSVVLAHAAAAVGQHGHLGQVAIVVGIGTVGVAELVDRELAQIGVDRQRGVGLVFLARQVRVPGRQAGTAGDPQAVHRAGVDRLVAHQAQAALVGVLVERQHRDRGRHAAPGVAPAAVARGGLELDDGKQGVAEYTVRLHAGKLDQRHAVRAVGEELARRTRRRPVDQRTQAGAVTTPGDDGLACAIPHRVAGDEEGLVGERCSLFSAVGEARQQARSDTHARQLGRLCQRWRGHRQELHAAQRGGARCRGGTALAQWQQGRTGQPLQRAPARGESGVGHGAAWT